MNCDQVFEVLTRGPFPTGAFSDEFVERHLGDCASCHRLAEALRPAIELFEEAVVPEERGQLPGYRGPWSSPIWEESAWADSMEADASRVGRQGLAAASAPRAGGSWLEWLPLAAAVVLGVLLGGLIAQRGNTAEKGSLATVRSAGPELALAGVQPRRVTIAQELSRTMGLATACFSPAVGNLPEITPARIAGNPAELVPSQASISDAAENQDLLCCTNCHSALGQAAGVKQATNQVLQSCRVCHLN